MSNRTRIGLFAVLLLLSGGAFIVSHTFKSVEDSFKDDVKSRYGESVEFVEFNKEDSNETTKSATLKGEDGEFICVKYFDQNGNEHFKDNYLGVKYEKEIQDLIAHELPEGCSAKVSIEDSVFGETKKPNETSMEDLLAMPTTYIYVDIESENEWSDASVEALAENLKGKVKVFCNIYWDNMKYYFTVNPSGEVVDTNVSEV